MYVNQDDELQGVGIRVSPFGLKERGEYHQNKLHGTAKITTIDNVSYWGEIKNNK